MEKVNSKKYLFILTPIGIFLASRLVVMLGMVFASYLPTNPGLPGTGVFEFGSLNHWDAGWYKGIVTSGYSWVDDGKAHNIVFFPLYPFFCRVVQLLSGLSVDAVMVIVSNAAFAAALILFHKLVMDLYDSDAALWATLFLAFFPTSMFFSAGYPESTCLLLSIATLYLLYNDRTLAASIVAGLAVAARPTMIVLAVPILVKLTQGFRPTRRYVAYSALCLFLSITGLIVYMVYLGVAFSDPLAFVKGTSGWNEANPQAVSMIDVLTLKAVYLDIKGGLTRFSARSFDGVFLLFFLAISAFGAYRRREPLYIYGLALVVFSYLTHGRFLLLSMGRYMVIVFPVFVLMAVHLKNPALRAVLLAVFSSMLFMYTAWFVKWYWAG